MQNDESHSEESESKSSSAGKSSISSSRFSKIKSALTTKKALVNAIAVFGLVAGGAGLYFVGQSDDPDTQQQPLIAQQELPTAVVDESGAGISIPYADGVSFADRFVPEFDDMRGYVERGEEHWYATFSSVIKTEEGSSGYSIVSAKDTPNNAITSFTDIALVGDDIWVGGQGGVVRLGGSPQEHRLYLEGVANTELAVDPVSGELYVGTFESGFFVYDKTQDSFSQAGNSSGAPRRVSEIAFSDQYVVAGESNEGLIRLLDKTTGEWSIANAEKFNDGNVDRSYIRFMQVEDQVIVYGRHVSYGSCASEGSFPATVVYQLRGAETVELSELTSLFTRNEARRYDFSESALYGSDSCDNDGDDFYVNLTVQDGVVTAGEKQQPDATSGFSGFTYMDRIAQLEQEVGFSQVVIPAQILSDQIVLLMKSSLSYAVYESTTKSPTSDLVESYSAEGSFPPVISHVRCSGQNFVISTSSSEAGYNEPYLNSIGVFANGELSRLYETTNGPLYEGVATEFDVGSSEAICVDDTLVLLGANSQIGVYDIANNTFVKTAVQDFATVPWYSRADHAKNEFRFFDRSSEAFVTFDVASQEFSSISLEGGVSTAQGSQIVLLAENENAIVLTNNAFKDGGSSALMSFNPVDGSIIERSGLTKRIHAGQELDDNTFILQYADGETKIVDLKTHKATKTISKPDSVSSPRELFPILRRIDSVFIVTDTHIWFNSDHWGLIAYAR